MRLRQLRIGAAAIALAAVVGASAAGAAPQPRWISVPKTLAHPESVFLSAGRLWFLRQTGNGGYTLRSAKRAGARFADWKTATPKLARGSWSSQRGSGTDLWFVATGGKSDGSVVAVRLLPTGQVGDPIEVAGAPAPQSSTGGSAVQLRDRVVRLVGISKSGGGFVSVLGACCDAAGKVVGFGSLPASTYARALLGVDRGGRLWLAWAPGRGGLKSQARMVELDPTTLKARGQVRMAPGFRGFVKIRALVCTDVCRLVVEGLVGRGMRPASWAPSDGAATTIRPPHRAKCQPSSCGGVIDARDDKGRLAVAYWADASQQGYTIGTALGDARGRRLRRVASIREPAQLGSFDRGVFLDSVPAGGLSSDGFAAFALYTGRSRAVLRVALLPIR
jgi:hypothetical protein